MKLIQDPVRKLFLPLNITCGIKVLTPGSPLIQSYDSITGDILPDRTKTPLCLLPDLSMYASDGSMSAPYDNSQILVNDSEHPFVWYANGKAIDTVYTKGTDYDLDTTGIDDSTLGVNTRGMLTFRRNLTKGEELELYFECYIRDARTSTYVHAVADPVTLLTAERGMDEYTLVVGGSPHFTYNPVNDTRLEYEYCTSHGITPEVPETDDDDVSYLHTWPLSLKQGSDDIDGYKIKLYDKTDTTTELSEDASDGVISILAEEVTIDTRLAESREFEIAAFLTDSEGNDVEVARETIGYSTFYPRIMAEAINGGRYNPTATVRTNGVVIAVQSQRRRSSTSPTAGQIRYPEHLMNITWYGTNSLSSDRITLGEGSKVTYQLSKLSLGSNDQGDAANGVASCNYVEDCDGEWKGTLSPATDSDGAVFTDGNGDVLAIY